MQNILPVVMTACTLGAHVFVHFCHAGWVVAEFRGVFFFSGGGGGGGVLLFALVYMLTCVIYKCKISLLTLT